jgi:hypothetical protein
MKLDLNFNGTGHGKYGLINNRSLSLFDEGDAAHKAIELLESLGILEWGPCGTESEFFVIKLRDVNARAALEACSRSAAAQPDEDLELAVDVTELAERSGGFSPFCKKPD